MEATTTITGTPTITTTITGTTIITTTITMPITTTTVVVKVGNPQTLVLVALSPRTRANVTTTSKNVILRIIPPVTTLSTAPVDQSTARNALMALFGISKAINAIGSQKLSVVPDLSPVHHLVVVPSSNNAHALVTLKNV